jgi:HK97 family phage prohead protease
MAELMICRAVPDTAMEPVGDGWTVGGLAVPYEQEQLVEDPDGSTYIEEIARASFRRDVAKGGRWVNLMIGHSGDDGDRFLGRCVRLEERDDGLWPWFRLNRDHPRAEEARSGELTGWSVSARVYESREVLRPGRKVIRRELLGLSHVAATPAPQYAGAGVQIAREHQLIVALPPGTPRLDAWRAKGYGGSRTS